MSFDKCTNSSPLHHPSKSHPPPRPVLLNSSSATLLPPQREPLFRFSHQSLLLPALEVHRHCVECAPFLSGISELWGADGAQAVVQAPFSFRETQMLMPQFLPLRPPVDTVASNLGQLRIKPQWSSVYKPSVFTFSFLMLSV